MKEEQKANFLATSALLALVLVCIFLPIVVISETTSIICISAFMIAMAIAYFIFDIGKL